MPPAILLDRVEKSFGHTRALKGLDLVVPTGEIHGFLGPNGAGKTVTVLGHHGGPAHANRWVRRPTGLALRQQRTIMVSWVIGAASLESIYGGLTRQVESLLRDNPTLTNMLGGAGTAQLTELFLSSALLILSLLASAAGVTVMLKMKAQEESGQSELLLAGALGRSRWALSHLVVALSTATLTVLIGGVALGVTASLSLHDWSEFPRLFTAAGGYAPAVMVVIAIAFACVAARPVWTWIAWAYLAFVSLDALLAESLRFPRWVRQGSPFQHLAALPGEAFGWVPFTVVTLVACAIVVASLMGVRVRDIG